MGKDIKSENVKFKVSHVAYALIAAVAAFATGGAWAEGVYWKGGSGGTEADPLILNTSNYTNASGEVRGVPNDLNFSVSSLTYITNTAAITTRVVNDFNVNSGDFVFLGPIHALAFKNNTANATVSIVKKGDWLLNGYNFSGGNADGVHSTFTNESGDLTCRAMFLGTCANTDVKFYHRAGTMTAGGIGSDVAQYGVCLASSADGAKTAYLEISGGLVKNTGDKSNLSIGDGNHTGSSTVYVTGNGEYRAEAGYVSVGSRSRGTLTIDNNGRVIASDKGVRFCDTSNAVAGRDSFLNLNGGTLETTTVTYGSGGANATFTFNGGILKALQAGTLIEAKPRLTVTVGAGGGTIDSGNYAIAIAEDLGGTGGMTFTGGNTITLNGAVSYTGKTAVTPGTILAVANETAKSNILANGLVLAGLPTADQTVMTYTSALDDTDLAKVSCPFAPTTTFKFSDETKTAIVVDDPGAVLDNYWTGEANDGDLSNAANWKSGVPTSGNANIFCATNSTLTKGATFAPTSITFLPGASATISGSGLTVSVISNLSTVVQTFACPVTFADKYRVHCDIAAVNFSGGATATCPASDMTDNAVSHTLKGNVTFTADWDCNYTLSNPYTVPNGSRLYGTSLTGNTSQIILAVSEGGYAEFSGNVYTGSGCGRIHVYGEIVVKGRWIMKGGWAGSAHVGYDGDENGNGIVRAKGIWKGDESNDIRKICYIKPPHIYIGSDGLGAKRQDYSIYFDAGAPTVYATDDFEIFGVEHPSNKHDWGLTLQKQVTFNTQGHTINWTGGADGNGNGALVKDGDGTLIFNPYGTHLSGAVTVKGGTLKVMSASGVSTGATTVKDGATLEVASGATLGSSEVTLEAGSTLALTATGNEFTALTNTLNLPTGENERATLRINGDRLSSGDHILVSGVSSGAADLLDVELAESVHNGRKYEVVEKNGNLVLSIDPGGLIIFVR